MGLNNTVHPHRLAQENTTTTGWSVADNKTFETGLGKYHKHPNKWLLVAAMTPGKTVVDVVHHHGKLVEDINQIEGGAFDAELWRFDNVNEYAPSSPAKFQEFDNRLSDDACRERPASIGDSSDKETKKKRGQHWTEDEHRRFVVGLRNHGNKWTLISREYVMTKTPQQVASHAQKYFARQEKTPGGNESRKRRRSIHDITIETVASTMMEESHHTLPAPTPHQNQTIGAPQQNPTEDMPQEEIENWVDHYNEQEWMGFDSNAGNTFEQSSFGFSTDHPVDLPPFP